MTINFVAVVIPAPLQDVIAVSGNPAYEQVTLKSIVVQENSAYSTVHTVSPPVAQYRYKKKSTKAIL